MILRLYLEAEIVTRAIVATLILKIFRGSMPRTPLGGCTSGTRVRLRRNFRNPFGRGPMLHSDLGPTNSLRGPGKIAWNSILCRPLVFYVTVDCVDLSWLRLGS